MHNQSPELVPTSEVCAALKVTPSTLSRWVQSGRITPAIKAPGLRGPMFFTHAEIARVKAEQDAA